MRLVNCMSQDGAVPVHLRLKAHSGTATVMDSGECIMGIRNNSNIISIPVVPLQKLSLDRDNLNNKCQTTTAITSLTLENFLYYL